MGEVRARRADEKNAKRARILETADAMAGMSTFAGFRMADLADKLGLAKGTFYLYFPTKEELFLNLLEDRLYSWIRALAARLNAMRGSKPRGVARVIREAFEADARVDQLLPLLESVIEQGIGLNTALRFKRRLMPEMANLAGALEQAVGGLPKGKGFPALIAIRALHTGFRQLATISPVVSAVLDANPELAPMRIEFGQDFENTLARTLKGFTKTKDKSKR